MQGGSEMQNATRGAQGRAKRSQTEWGYGGAPQTGVLGVRFEQPLLAILIV